MKILILDTLDTGTLINLLSDNILYRPDLLHKSGKILANALIETGADAVVGSDALPVEVMRSWLAARVTPTYFVRINVGLEFGASDKDALASLHDSTRLVTFQASGFNQESAYISALEILEREHTFRRSQLTKRHVSISKGKKSDTHILMVGAGLVNLITAHTLQKAGYALRFVDAGPDPRGDASWTAYGCSRGGDDARMFTLSEMDNYNDRNISSAMNRQFQYNVDECGWNVRWKGAQLINERQWIEEFENIPVWLANRYNEDIFAFNRESQPLWEAWIKEAPRLFEDSYLREGILRLYSDADHFANAVQRQNRIGATKQILTPEEIS